MPKALCLTSLAIAVLVLLLFGSDLVCSFAGMNNVAPFAGANLLIDVMFSIVGIILAVMSWFTYREQV